jgi:hypothetical protein
MTPTSSVTGLRRRVFLPVPADPVPVPPAPPQPQDPPIYRALIRTWADRGRTLPGRHDPEWARLTAPPRTTPQGACEPPWTPPPVPGEPGGTVHGSGRVRTPDPAVGGSTIGGPAAAPPRS